MAKTSIKAGTTSYLARVLIQDSSKTDGSGLTGLTSSSVASWKIYTARDDDGNAAGVGVSLQAGTRGTWSSGGFVEKDSTNMPGVYEIGIPNASIASGSKTALLMLKGATNMAPLVLEYELTLVDNQSATAFMTSVATVTTVTNQLTAAQIATGVWQDTTAGDFTVALSIGKSVMNGVSLGTGLTVNAVTTVNGLANNVITAASIAASALNGKGDWLLSSSYTAPLSAAATATAVWTDTTASDFTTALSVGKSVMNGVALGTGLTINGYTGNTPQTGDAFARIGAAGVSLSAIPDLAGVTTLLSRLSALRAGYLDNLSAGAVALASGVTVTTNSDKTGYALTAAYDPAKTAAQAGDAMALTAGERTTLTAAIWAYVLTGTTTAVQAMRGFIAAMLGKASGLDTNAPKYRDIADTKNVISATTDANGNRTAVTLDLT